MRWALPQAGLAAALALCAATEWLSAPERAAPLPVAVSPAPAAGSAAVDDLFTPRWAGIILARPLFRADRRPLATATAAVDQTLPRLTAIIITAAGRRAIFAAGGDAASVVSAGGRIGAYQVQRIAPDSVGLLGPNGAVTVHPQYAAAAPAAAPSPPRTSARLSNDPM